jgi:glycosyltransferase involved in cell wall biosynthesis
VAGNLPDASVIVATYRQLQSTSLALQALFAQRTQYSYEVIVCDDGSDATTVAGLLDVLAAAPVPAYLTWQQDRGFRLAASRNNGVRVARGNVLIFLDGDMVPEEDFVETHVRAHVRPNLIAVGKRLFRAVQSGCTEGGEPGSFWNLLRSDQAVSRESRAQEAFERLYRHYASKDQPWMNCFGCNLSVTKSPLIEFDEAFRGWGNEDWDLFYGLTKVNGFEVVPIDAVAYEVSSEFDKRNAWKQSQFIEHLVTGFQFFDKWAHTGLKPHHAIARHDFDPETERWTFSRHRVSGAVDKDFPKYLERTRRWLVERGHYTASPAVSPGPERDNPAEV